MTEDQIIKLLSQAVAAAQTGITGADATSEDVDTARAVLALLGPAPLEWVIDGLGLVAGSHRGLHRIRLLSDQEAWGHYFGDRLISRHDTEEAAQRAAEAHHRAAWFAGTVLGREASHD